MTETLDDNHVKGIFKNLTYLTKSKEEKLVSIDYNEFDIQVTIIQRHQIFRIFRFQKEFWVHEFVEMLSISF